MTVSATVLPTVGVASVTVLTWATFAVSKFASFVIVITSLPLVSAIPTVKEVGILVETVEDAKGRL